MDSREDPLLCHEVLHNMEYECLRHLGVHLVIHYDPVITHDPELTALKEKLEDLLQQFAPGLSLHDFRMIPGQQHRNLVFDVPLPAALRGQEGALIDFLEEAMATDPRGPFHLRLTFDVAQE